MTEARSKRRVLPLVFIVKILSTQQKNEFLKQEI